MSVTDPGAVATAAGTRTIFRYEVRARLDPRAEAVTRESAHVGVRPMRVRTARVYLIGGPFSSEEAQRVGARLLADPVLEEWRFGAADPTGELIEVHPLPGVMDPVAQTLRQSIGELTGADDVEVVTGWRYDVEGVTPDEADELARRLLANEVVEAIHREPWTPDAFPHAPPADQSLRHIPIRALDDAGLERLSREGHLFLSLDEMRAIRAEYERRGREPTDIELETLAQTWSEHCVHKTLKSTIRIPAPDDADPIDWRRRPGHEVQPDGSIIIHNLLKSTVAAATHELIDDGLDWTLSVFVDNAGVIAFDDEHAVCVKVETHNHPSAIEPYGGAATGIGGVIRDIMGTGLGARPVANTDVFCVAFPEGWGEGGGAKPLPAGCLHPRRVLTRVVDGVRDYGNRMGIPTVNGAVWFDDRFVGNPLVFAGSVGVMRREHVGGAARPGDRIIAIGGRTGRDGIHGATFSSAELTDTHADEFSHAVQIGNAIEEKRTLDALLRARDHASGCLYSAITDCGAGGFSSAVGEMSEKVGAEVELSAAPLKYAGLRYDEIWISESQERMVLAVPPEKVETLRAICAEEHVELADLGAFGATGDDGPELALRFEGREVGRMGMGFLHEGIPMGVREASWARKVPKDQVTKGQRGVADVDIREALLGVLAHPNVASREWIVRQYDHEVQGATAIRPLVGTGAPPIGPGDAAVIQPVPGSARGLAIGCGLAIPVGDPETGGAGGAGGAGGDPYLMALAAVDECVRNLVCVGADPERIAILDNFCWPSCAKPENLGALVRAAEGCYDAAKAYRTPFVSGKDSLNNQFRTESGRVIEIPPTLLITGVGVVPDVGACVTMDLKPEPSQVMLVGGAEASLVGGVFESVTGVTWGERRSIDLAGGVRAAHAVATLIREGFVLAAHDCSEGGALTAMAEMAIAGDLGVEVFLDDWESLGVGERWEQLFGEGVGRYVLQTRDPNQMSGDELERFSGILKGMSWRVLGDVRTTAPGRFEIRGPRAGAAIADLRAAFEGGMGW